MQDMHSSLAKCCVLEHSDLILQAVVQEEESAIFDVMGSRWTALENCTVLPWKICTAV
jgi:hypothetical protein